jgi:hypothetical protein
MWVLTWISLMAVKLNVFSECFVYVDTCPLLDTGFADTFPCSQLGSSQSQQGLSQRKCFHFGEVQFINYYFMDQIYGSWPCPAARKLKDSILHPSSWHCPATSWRQVQGEV